MGEVIRFITKSEHERARLIREARAIYNSIFPPADLDMEQRDKAPLSQKKVVQMPGAATEFRHDQGLRRALQSLLAGKLPRAGRHHFGFF